VFRASAEARLHAAIYCRFPRAGCVLHSHSVASTVLSRRIGAGGVIRLSGYELLKAVEGIHTHEAALHVPVFTNRQNMDSIAAEASSWWSRSEMGTATAFFVLEGHGLYVWGTSIEQARRHAEAVEFMFECQLSETTGPRLERRDP
jgi:methylthioribulose-1-phosphate dehydratase